MSKSPFSLNARLQHPGQAANRKPDPGRQDYWNEARQGITEMYRILREEGQIVLTYTGKRDLEKKEFVQYGVKTYEEEEARLMLAEAGFREIKAILEQDQHCEFICITGWK